MTLGVLAKKVGMTQIFTAEGVRIPVTVLQVLPNRVVQKKTVETDGYNALQLGMGEKREKVVPKPMLGHFKKAGTPPALALREFRVSEEELSKYNVGDEIGLDLFLEVKSVDVSAKSKGRGFAGVMKRHNFAGFPASHGTHEYFRHGGSIGMRAKPGKVLKGKRMAGHMGDERVTVLNLGVAEVAAERGFLLVRGAVPGAKNAIVEVRPSKRKPNKVPGLGPTEQIASKNPMKASKTGAGKR